MLNSIVLQGRLTKDVEIRTTPNDVMVGRFTLAVDRDFPKGTDFVSCVVWRKTAEFAQKWFHRGDMTVVEGKLQSRKWTDSNGKEQTSWEVQADKMHFCGKKSESSFDVPANTFADMGDDDSELPF